MRKIKILQTDFELNMFNLQDARRVEAAVAAFETARTKTLEDADSLAMSEIVEQLCKAAFLCFDTIFGMGAANKIFGTECDFLLCADAIADLMHAVTESQKTALEQRFAAYLPNRQK